MAAVKNSEDRQSKGKPQMSAKQKFSQPFSKAAGERSKRGVGTPLFAPPSRRREGRESHKVSADK